MGKKSWALCWELCGVLVDGKPCEKKAGHPYGHNTDISGTRSAHGRKGGYAAVKAKREKGIPDFPEGIPVLAGHMSYQKRSREDWLRMSAKSGKITGPIVQDRHRLNQTGMFDPEHRIQKYGAHISRHLNIGKPSDKCEFCLGAPFKTNEGE